MNKSVIKTKSQDDQICKWHRNSLTDIYLTYLTQTFISGPSLYPILKPFLKKTILLIFLVKYLVLL